jgi:hypothetical protein
MKTFIYSILTIIVSITILFLITLLLDVQFISAQPVRQFLVYLIMLIVAFIGTRLLIAINYPTKLDK